MGTQEDSSNLPAGVRHPAIAVRKQFQTSTGQGRNDQEAQGKNDCAGASGRTEKVHPSGGNQRRLGAGFQGVVAVVRGTVRSGQRVFYEGNIVIIGDVNPGGEVIAGGNILVLGTLRGVAHAGATGNQEAVVASYCLQPTQLRIAGFIARAPEGETEKPSYPEVAYIREEQLFIEPYLPGKGKQPDSILFNKV